MDCLFYYLFLLLFLYLKKSSFLFILFIFIMYIYLHWAGVNILEVRQVTFISCSKKENSRYSGTLI
jgi:hypothetical protein